MEITSLSQLDLTKSYSYFDYLTWNFNQRVELLRGKIFEMSPAPSTLHQRISNKISFSLTQFLENQKCEVFVAPFDVRLETFKNEKAIKTVVQPDICVVCDLNILDEKGCFGAPSLIVEIISPGNSKKEMGIKFELYQQAGVSEYWIVDTQNEIILQYCINQGKYFNEKPLVLEDTLHSKTLSGFSLPLKKIFSN